MAEIAQRTPARQASGTMLAVYAGRTCTGFILAKGKLGFVAYDADERCLGSFQNQDEAAAAISAAMQARQ